MNAGPDPLPRPGASADRWALCLLEAEQTVTDSTPGALGDLVRRHLRSGDDGVKFRTTLTLIPAKVSWQERGQERSVIRQLRVASMSR